MTTEEMITDASTLFLNGLSQREAALHGRAVLDLVAELEKTLTPAEISAVQSSLEKSSIDEAIFLAAIANDLQQLSTTIDPYSEKLTDEYQLDNVAGNANAYMESSGFNDATAGPVTWAFATLLGAGAVLVLAAAYAIVRVSSKPDGNVEAHLKVETELGKLDMALSADATTADKKIQNLTSKISA